MATLTLPTSNGRLEAFSTSAQPNPAPAAEPFCRIALAATHIVADPLADCDPWLDAVVDWDATIAYRRYVWDLGLGVAEAMDTAQRGMGLDWAGAQELIRRSIDASSDTPGAVVASGVGTAFGGPSCFVCGDTSPTFALPSLAWVPSQYGGLLVALHWQRNASLSSSTETVSGVIVVTRCDPSQNGWLAERPHAHQ